MSAHELLTRAQVLASRAADLNFRATGICDYGTLPDLWSASLQKAHYFPDWHCQINQIRDRCFILSKGLVYLINNALGKRFVQHRRRRVPSGDAAAGRASSES